MRCLFYKIHPFVLNNLPVYVLPLDPQNINMQMKILKKLLSLKEDKKGKMQIIACFSVLSFLWTHRIA